MMKKTVHILFLCLFFLLGLQCNASNKKALPCTGFAASKSNFIGFKNFSFQEKSSHFTATEKLVKKRRFSKTPQNAITSSSKCKDLGFGTTSSSDSKFLINTDCHFCNNISEDSFHASFCHRKKLSIFYTFQAFW